MGFFLGKDISTQERVVYTPKHLTTHGLIFGMTGSGKTGLAIGLLEEAQRAQIPIIAIDPKGDLTNLALSWPDLSPVNFARWVDPSKLANQGAVLDAAAETAETWRKGLERSGLSGQDIEAMRRGSHVTVYTPGSSAGVQVSMLDRFEPPEGYANLPEEDKGELISGVVAALLSLLKITADSLQSREFILLANILRDAWSRHESLDLQTLVQRVSEPPFSRLGVVDIEDFFPARRRKELAMQINSLIASPSFEPWRSGASLDIQRLFQQAPQGSRTSIFSIGHLDDSERMSFVTLLLERIIAWMRAQPGTGELRALLYMDEVFGYLPPHPANPPSKRAILTLLKQARAFGLGVLLATQNPVDVDYKSLTNAGTWFIGKLQAEQDKERVLDGLMSASAGVSASRSEISRQISALEPRQFLLQNAHESGAKTFSTRFCMSYLRGPLTRSEIATLKEANFYNAPEVAALAPRLQTPVAAPQVNRTASPYETVEVQSNQPPVGGGWGAQVGTSSTPQASPINPVPQAPEIKLPKGISVWRLADQVPPLVWSELGARPGGHQEAFFIARARATFGIAGWQRLGGGLDADLGEMFYVSHSLGVGPDQIRLRAAPSLLPHHLTYVEPNPALAKFLPSWTQDERIMSNVRMRLIAEVAGLRHVTVPVSPSLRRFGEPSENLESFRMRLAGQVSSAAQNVKGRLEVQKDIQATHFDKKIQEMQEFLRMDTNEIKMLMASGDSDALEKAKVRARVRLEKFKELQAQREHFLGLTQRDITDVEFQALDQLEDLELRTIRLTPQQISLVQLGLIWMPI